MSNYNELNTPLNNFTCRICLEDDQPENMIYPCKCKGTAKYVHKHCLNEWRTTADNRENFHRCEMCHYEYKISSSPLIESNFSKFFRSISSSFIGFYILYSLLIFGLGKFYYNVDTEKEIFETLSHTNSTTSDFVQPFYYLFSGLNIFLFQIILICFWFYKAKNKNLYCKLYKKNRHLILNSLFIMFVSGFLFSWLISILFLELISLRLFQIHFN